MALLFVADHSRLCHFVLLVALDSQKCERVELRLRVWRWNKELEG